MSIRPLSADLGAAEADIYEQWKRNGRHWEEYASEFVGTLFLLFVVVIAVAVLLGPTSAALLLPSKPPRLFLLGLGLGGASWLVALSPPGRLSGAHLNPAVSLGFWVLGKLHVRDLIGYIVAQMLGGVAGAALGVLVCRPLAHAVHDATLAPGPGVGAWPAFWGEAGTTFVLTSLVYTFVSHKRLMRWTPAAAMLMVGVLIWLDAGFSGAGMNPSRWYGPAWVLPSWHLWWVFALGPMLGAAGAGLARRLLPGLRSVPHTGKLFHDPLYRSIFRCDTVPSVPPQPSLKHFQE